MLNRNDSQPQEWHKPESFLREARQRGFEISRGLLYDALRRGLIPSVRIGRKILIPADALDRMLSRSTERNEGANTEAI